MRIKKINNFLKILKSKINYTKKNYKFIINL